MEIFRSPYLCGYHKGFNAQHALLAPLEKWTLSLYRACGAVLMDLSKAFDTLSRDLLINFMHMALNIIL